MRRCLTCGKLTEGTRCDEHRLARKRRRSRDARTAGHCPQDGLCGICGDGPRLGDPMEWHHTTAFSRYGVRMVPAHASCNRSKGTRV